MTRTISVSRAPSCPRTSTLTPLRMRSWISALARMGSIATRSRTISECVVERLLRQGGLSFLSAIRSLFGRIASRFDARPSGLCAREFADQIRGPPAEVGEKRDRRLLDEISLGEAAIERRLRL